MSTAVDQHSPSEDGEVKAGTVGPLDQLAYEDKYRAETATWLAKVLVGIFGASVGLHYVLTAVLVYCGKQDSINGLNDIFNAWLPVISGLVSAATTYYFTKKNGG
jgi:hypothetical protein